MKKIAFAMLAVVVLATACKKDRDDQPGMFKGPEVQVHHGKAWTWFQLNTDGTPKRLAITINDAALNSVPAGGSHSGGGMDTHGNSFVLKFHPKADLTPFKHVLMDWSPEGHPPPQIYGLPHFDLHFYLTSQAEREAIPPYEVDSSKFLNFPGPAYLPANYFPFPGGVPQMGTHWGDATSPEFHGQKFTQTFLYGSYNGQVTYYEPMITLEFLKNTNKFERPIPTPAKFQKTGYYPTKMSISKHDKVTDIILEDFVYRQQS